MRSIMAVGLSVVVAIISLPWSAGALPHDVIEARRLVDGHCVRKLLEQDPLLVQATDERGFTPLHWAGIRGHWDVFSQLLDAGAPVNAIGGDGGTPLHWACHHDRPAMIQRLLEQGADLALSNQWGRYALHVAAGRGCLSVAKLLLGEGADPNCRTREGWTPLHVAQKSGHDQMVDLLRAKGADPEATDDEGRSPGDFAYTRPAPIERSPEELREYVGIYDLGPGFAFKFWLEGGALKIQEFAPDDLVPIGPDAFLCAQEPWRVRFLRGEDAGITAVEVDFLRRTVTGQRREHPQYIGSRSCRECHLDGEHANQYLDWVRSRHAGAYWHLATDWAILLASFRPAYKDITKPIEEDRCLLCHVTAAQDPDALHAETYRLEEGVGCETCHGPGSLYANLEGMQNRESFLERGGVVPDETTCTQCHRNPDHFDFVTWWPKIDHRQESAAEHSGD